MTSVFRKTLYLLKLLARENEAVQLHIFERLDILLDVRVVESELAIALREVRWFSYVFRIACVHRYVLIAYVHRYVLKVKIPFLVNENRHISFLNT